ncbi:unnamed protein product [Caenorhabditis bovis]|uniref:ShKT domain-containing protein n=1 Tax=Caenorhabditis bovis TaxID=2654633 RepID=A0A8S1E512_9PELO|nr:unnamed protein product [Caenorhabditis bovis]
MLLFILATLVASTSALSCANEQGPCIETSIDGLNVHLCPDGMGCLNNQSCCLFEDIVSGPVTTTPSPNPGPSPSNNCVDKVNPNTGVSDCPKSAYLCDNSAYRDLMTDQCPKTCNRCGGNVGSTVAPVNPVASCVDKVNPSTGISECSQKAYLCTNAAYRSVMQDQCPKTCGFC